MDDNHLRICDALRALSLSLSPSPKPPLRSCAVFHLSKKLELARLDSADNVSLARPPTPHECSQGVRHHSLSLLSGISILLQSPHQWMLAPKTSHSALLPVSNLSLIRIRVCRLESFRPRFKLTALRWRICKLRILLLRRLTISLRVEEPMQLAIRGL